MIGQHLGDPFEQDVKGTLLFDVKDKGYDVTQGARFSDTRAASTFHTDNACGCQVPDFVGLLYCQQAQQGGNSQWISAVTLHNELLEKHPNVLQTLYQSFYFDRRGEFSKGESPVSSAPVFSWNGSELTIRCLHYYILVGHQRRVRRRLTSNQEEAFNSVEAPIQQPRLRIEFSLQPGQILWTNNHWILHNRTAFEDSPAPPPEKHRRYTRLWLSR